MKVKNINIQPSVLLAELVGTFILATVAITVANPIILGFTLVVLVVAIGAISGAHVNPAITFGLWSIKKLEGIKVPFYWAMQFAGALLALLASQLYQGKGYGLSFASFNSLDAKILLAEIIGTAVFAFAVASAFERKDLDTSAKGLVVGLGLLAGIAVGSGLIGMALQNVSITADSTPRITKIDGAVLNPAIALSATEKADQSSGLQLNEDGTQKEEETKKFNPSRLSWETLLGALIGGSVGMNIFMVAAGKNPFQKKETASAKVTAVFKKGKKEVKKATKKAKK